MFKFLFNFLDSFNFGKETLESYLERTQDKEIKFFNDNLNLFPFYNDAVEALKKSTPGYLDLEPGDQLYKLISFILGMKALTLGTYLKEYYHFIITMNHTLLLPLKNILLNCPALENKLEFTLRFQKSTAIC